MKGYLSPSYRAVEVHQTKNVYIKQTKQLRIHIELGSNVVEAAIRVYVSNTCSI